MNKDRFHCNFGACPFTSGTHIPLIKENRECWEPEVYEHNYLKVIVLCSLVCSLVLFVIIVFVFIFKGLL